MIFNGLFHSSVYVILERVLSVDDIHMESSAGDVEYRSVTEETGEFRRVHSGRGDYRLEVLTTAQYVSQETKQYVSI